MDEINPSSPKPDSGFTKKPVEPTFLDSSLRDRLSPEDALAAQSIGSGGNFRPGSGSAFGNFYRQNKLYFWAIFAGLLIIGGLSYLVFHKSTPTAPKEANVNISIDAPDTVASGSDVVYKVKVDNQDSQTLTRMQLELTYPDGETYEDSSPKASNLSGTLFPVPDLLSGQNAVVIVKAKATGSVNDQKQLVAKIHYQFSNSSLEFAKSATNTIRLVASDIVLELSGPQSSSSAQLIIYNVKYQNNSGADIANARIKLTYPDGFQFASAQPQPDLGSDTWDIGTLAKDGSGNITVQGNFNSASPGESKTAQADFLVLGSDGQYAVQNSSSFTTQIASLPLIVTQQLAQDHPGDVVNPGDILTFAVDYQNNNTTAATGVNVIVTLDPKVLDLSTIRAEGAQVTGNTITWNAASFPQLDNLAPSETGHLSYQVQVKNPAARDNSKNLTVVSNIKIKSNEYDSYFPGNTLTLKVSSPATLTTSLSYVSGSLPPKVGTDTVYKVRLSLINSTNDFSNGILTLFLPLGPGGYLDGSATPSEKNNVQYDSSANKLTWNVGSLPANTGKFSQPRVLEFSIRLNPSASQANTSPTLVKDINFNATDNFTGDSVQINADDILTSDLTGSNMGYGNGIVQP